MGDKHETTDKVQKMFTQFPFPDIDCRMYYGLKILRFLKGLEKKRPDFWRSAKVMEAGCGTGNTLNHLAEIFPKATFLGQTLPLQLFRKQRKKQKI
jgi:tRNA G46 methylase TrmB